MGGWVGPGLIKIKTKPSPQLGLAKLELGLSLAIQITIANEKIRSVSRKRLSEDRIKCDVYSLASEKLTY